MEKPANETDAVTSDGARRLNPAELKERETVNESVSRD